MDKIFKGHNYSMKRLMDQLTSGETFKRKIRCVIEAMVITKR